MLRVSVKYTRENLEPWQAGAYLGTRIVIDPTHRDDVGLLEHERTHEAQAWRTFGLHFMWYNWNTQYRQRCEVEAYKKQLECEPNRHRREQLRCLFAKFLCTRYGLEITEAGAWLLLGGRQ